VSKNPGNQPGADEGPAPGRGVWLLSNGAGVITVLGSATVAVLASVVHFSTEELEQIVLLLLALIGTSLVTDRLIEGRKSWQQITSISSRLDTVVSFTRNENVSLDDVVITRRQLPSLEERLVGASHIMVSGGSLSRLSNEYRSLFERLAHQGCRLRFIMTNPASPGAEFLSAEISYESRSFDAYRSYMQDAAAGLTDLAQSFPETCEVRTYDAAPPFSLMVIVQPDSSSVQVELYTLGLPARDRPILLTSSASSPRLCALFTAQFESLWASPLTRPISTGTQRESDGLGRDVRQ
jgi:hypothetical protein